VPLLTSTQYHLDRTKAPTYLIVQGHNILGRQHIRQPLLGILELLEQPLRIHLIEADLAIVLVRPEAQHLEFRRI